MARELTKKKPVVEKLTGSRTRGLPNKATLPVTKWTVPNDAKLQLLRKENPKSPYSPSYARYELYRTVKTVGDYRDAMRKEGTAHYANLDLARDYNRGYISFKFETKPRNHLKMVSAT